MNRIVIDTDPGVDDAHAILMACSHPDTQVVALTTVAGNVSCQCATLNALKILEVVGKDIPVYPGCEDALVIPARRAISHGADGLGDSRQFLGTRLRVQFLLRPEAAAVVFQRWPEIILLPWETTLAHSLSRSQVEELGRELTPGRNFSGDQKSPGKVTLEGYIIRA
jgi:inosine-uridine nucleoside N-ribohydrolase